VGTFHEAFTCQMLGDLDALLAPRLIRLAAQFHVRGGITTSVLAEQQNKEVHLPTTPVGMGIQTNGRP
jgi:7-cyano-7-deazaguanine reductase